MSDLISKPTLRIRGDKRTSSERNTFAASSVSLAPYVWAPPIIFVLTTLISLTVIVGWEAHVPALIRLLPSLPPVRFNCAMMQLIAAVSMLMVNLGRKKLAILMSAGLLFFASLFLAQFLFSSSFGIDSFLMPSTFFSSELHPGRISLVGAVGFFLIGLSALCLALPRPGQRLQFTVSVAGFVCLAIGVSAAIGLMAGFRDPGVWNRFNGVTPQGAFFFSLMGIGINWHLWIRQICFEPYLARWASRPPIVGILVGAFILDKALRMHGAVSPVASLNLSYSIFAAAVILSAFVMALSNQFRKSQKEMALRKRAESYVAVMEHSHDAIYSIDLEGNVLSWNRGSEKLFGYDAREMIGSTVFRLSAPSIHQSVRDAIAYVVKEGSLINYEAWRLRKDGAGMLLSFTVSPVRSLVGDILYLSIVARDITDKTRGQPEIQR